MPEIFDVVILRTSSNFNYGEYQTNRPPESDFEIETDLWVGPRLPHGVNGRLVFDSCQPRGFNFDPVRQYGMRYALFRHVPEGRDIDYYEWDADRRLGKIILVSQLIHPTTIGSNLSAKLYFENDELTMIVPDPTEGFGAYVYTAPSSRNWLSLVQFEQLRGLVSRYIPNPPERVKIVRFHALTTLNFYYINHRSISVVSGYEGLFKTSKNNAKLQFKTRLPKLAELVGVTISEDEAALFYDKRSALVHGAELRFGGEKASELPPNPESPPSEINDYQRFEEALRLSVLKACTEPDFAALFKSNDSVDKAFETSGSFKDIRPAS